MLQYLTNPHLRLLAPSFGIEAISPHSLISSEAHISPHGRLITTIPLADAILHRSDIISVVKCFGLLLVLTSKGEVYDSKGTLYLQSVKSISSNGRLYVRQDRWSVYDTLKDLREPSRVWYWIPPNASHLCSSPYLGSVYIIDGVAYFQWIEDVRALIPERDWLTDISHTEGNLFPGTRSLLHRITTAEPIRSIAMYDLRSEIYLIGEKTIYGLHLAYMGHELMSHHPDESTSDDVLTKVWVTVDHTYDSCIKEVKSISNQWYGVLLETGDLYYSGKPPIHVQSKVVAFNVSNTGTSVYLEDGTVCF